MKTNFLERLRDGEVLICDGAMGTMLQRAGLQPGEASESWCVSHAEVVTGISKAYVAAGSDIVLTNSFGANSLKLKSYGIERRVEELNRAAVAVAKTAVGDKGYVFASVGPTGGILAEEGGDLVRDSVYAAYQQQVLVLAEAGVDAICCETMSSLEEALLAIKAAKESTKLPVVCTFTFQSRAKGFRTMMGVSPERASREAEFAGADVVGANCVTGMVSMIEVTREIRAACPSIPILAQANAGTPVMEEGKTVYQETPEYMASRVADLLDAGANIIGGCCGTTPEHIAAMAKAVRRIKAENGVVTSS